MKTINLFLFALLLLLSIQGVEAKRSRSYYNFKSFDERFRAEANMSKNGFASLTVYGSRISVLDEPYYLFENKRCIRKAQKESIKKIVKSKGKKHSRLTRRDYEKMAKNNGKK